MAIGLDSGGGGAKLDPGDLLRALIQSRLRSGAIGGPAPARGSGTKALGTGGITSSVLSPRIDPIPGQGGGGGATTPGTPATVTAPAGTPGAAGGTGTSSGTTGAGTIQSPEAAAELAKQGMGEGGTGAAARFDPAIYEMISPEAIIMDALKNDQGLDPTGNNSGYANDLVSTQGVNLSELEFILNSALGDETQGGQINRMNDMVNNPSWMDPDALLDMVLGGGSTKMNDLIEGAGQGSDDQRGAVGQMVMAALNEMSNFHGVSAANQYAGIEQQYQMDYLSGKTTQNFADYVRERFMGGEYAGAVNAPGGAANPSSAQIPSANTGGGASRP